jgi:hypothetical protein
MTKKIKTLDVQYIRFRKINDPWGRANFDPWGR